MQVDPFFSIQSVITSSSSMVSAVSRKTPGVKVRQPLSGSYLIHTSSCLISSLLFMGAGPSVAQGMEYLIREKLQHPRGNFNTVCVLLLLFSQDTNQVCVLSVLVCGLSVTSGILCFQYTVSVCSLKYLFMFRVSGALYESTCVNCWQSHCVKELILLIWLLC